MELHGKELKSTCNSCGGITIHDANHKAGKALVNYLKQGGGVKEDITKKNKAAGGTGAVLEDTTQASTQLGGEDSDEILAAFSDEEVEATYKSRRVGK